MAALALAGVLALAACSDDGGGSAGGDTDEAAVAPYEPAPGGAREDAGGSSESGGDASDGDAAGGETGTTAPVAADGRQVIRTAWLTVSADDVPGAYADALAIASAAGGFVSSENTSADGGEQVSSITLRVPQDRYDRVVTDLAELGELVDRQVTTEDVTEELVDTESRLATQRESVARVRALMDEAASIRDIVALEGELAARQAELESLEARLEELNGQVALATITLELVGPDTTVAEEDDDPSVTGALGDGWDAFTGTLRWAVVVIAVLLPFLGAAALVLLALWPVVRRRRRTTPVAVREETPAPDDDGADVTPAAP
ncbi:DUF4349 domain-containing protein [Streptomyces sp. RFCAC02]|uniref:DUF4349 domain-containing protein n=1 Tax=Streptomyces sp. RFCAC02 TaxID=2499143 RepID=UPI00143D4A18|nr:DUF4349 domain-containing protein [Streptomyces sp. RFCAC02]